MRKRADLWRSLGYPFGSKDAVGLDRAGRGVRLLELAVSTGAYSFC